MKNNKGLTLVELLGVLVVLSLVVMIVVPSVTRNLKLSRIELCQHQLESLVSASKNWLTDQIDDNYDTVFADGQFISQTVTGETLWKNGYVSELDEDYHEVVIYISKNGNNYEYIVEEEYKYCQ